MSDSLQPHELQPARLLCTWNFPGKNIGVGGHFLLQGIFLTQGSNPHLLHWQTGLLSLSHQGSLCVKNCATCFTQALSMNPYNPITEILLFLFYRWGIRKQAACSRSYLLEFINGWPTSVLFKSQFTCHFLQEICPHDKNAAYYLFFVLWKYLLCSPHYFYPKVLL